MKLLRILLALSIFLISTGIFAQTGQLQPGQVFGNTGSSEALPLPTLIGPLLDKGYCGTQGSILVRQSSTWACLTPGTSSFPLLSQGAGANLQYGQIQNSALCAGSSGASSSTFLRGDCTWATPSGSGNVSGPGSSVNLDCALYSGTSGTVLQDLGGCPIVFGTVTSLRANTAAIKSVYLLGYTTQSDGGEGILNYVPSDVTSTDNGCTIFVDSSNHRYYRTAAYGSVNVKWCGATGNGSTNDAAAINAAVQIACNGNATIANPTPFIGGAAFFPPGNYVVDGGINLHDLSGGYQSGGCSLRGSGNNATMLLTKTGGTNNMLDIIGTSNVIIKDLFIRASSGTTVVNNVAVAASNLNPCNVIEFENVGMDTFTSINSLLAVQNCSEGLVINGGFSSYSPATSTHNLIAITASNPYGWGANSGATISGAVNTQSGGWNFFQTQLHDITHASGTSTVIPFFMECGSGGYAPVNWFGGIIAGSVAGGTGGTVTTQGVCTGISFNGVNFYGDNGTQSAYAFFPNGNVTSLTFQECAILTSSGVMAAITGITYSDVHFTANNGSTSVFIPPSGNNGTVTNSMISATGRAINLGASGILTHTVMTSPGTITAGTQSSNGSF